MNFKIAIVQFAINQFNSEKNLVKAEQFIAEASSENDLIVFPEEFIVGPLNGRTAPFKGALKSLNHNKEAMFSQEVDTALLADAAEAYEIRKDLKKGLHSIQHQTDERNRD